jgi:hypothetical protein
MAAINIVRLAKIKNPFHVPKGTTHHARATKPNTTRKIVRAYIRMNLTPAG